MAQQIMAAHSAPRAQEWTSSLRPSLHRHVPVKASTPLARQRTALAVRAGAEPPASPAEEAKAAPVSGGGCPGCGRTDVLGGCNGEGRIQGGVGALPGFGWWPIKAYRPCPAFLEAGGKYRRQGQSLEEVAFGRKGLDDDLDITERLEKLTDSNVKERLKKLKEEEKANS